MRFIKEYWFGITISIFLLCAVVYFVLVFVSPRYDLQRRGFVSCTEELASNVESCGRNSTLCTMGAIWADNVCNMQIIAQGFQNWINGEQETPWSNYIFEPELPQEVTDENTELENFYQENPNLYQDMQNLKKLNKEHNVNE